MKKVVALLLAGVLTLGASMTAFAAPSPSGNTSNATITATSDQGNVIISQDYKTEAEKKAAQDLAEHLKDQIVTVTIKAGEGGRTFGSVSTKEISAAVKKQLDLDLDKKKMVLHDPIRSLGTFEVPVKLHPKVTATLRVKVTEE